MALIPVTYVYADATTLVPANHNRNIFSATGSEGIFSEPNGGLELLNLGGGFFVRAEHVWPEEAVRMRQESLIEDNDLLNAAIGVDAGLTAWVPIPGLNLRIYVPYTFAFALWQWSFFESHFRFSFDLASGAQGIAFRTFLDGGGILHSQRHPVQTVYSRKNSADASSPHRLERQESLNAVWYDQAHLSIGLGVGWHELSVRINMENTPPGHLLGRDTDGDGVFDDHAHTVFSRASFGIRNVRMVGFHGG